MPQNFSKTKYVIANWKMNLALADITHWLDVFRQTFTSKAEEKKIILAPSLPYLGIMSELLKTSLFELAGQNISLHAKGAHTGETGAFQIKDFCKYAIVGHSELKETFEDSLKKRDICLNLGITPIICVAKLANMADAYKPGTLVVWEDPASISQNGVSRAKEITEIQKDIEICRQSIPSSEPLLYGGSVNRENIADLAKITGLNGILVGSASNDAKHFAELALKF